MNCNLLMFYFIVACRCLQRLLVPKQPRTQEDGLRLQICWILFQLLFLSSLIFQQNCDGKILHQILVSFKIGKKDIDIFFVYEVFLIDILIQIKCFVNLVLNYLLFHFLLHYFLHSPTHHCSPTLC